LVKTSPLHIPLSHLTPSLEVIPCEHVTDAYISKTRINGLSVGEDDIILCSLVLTQYERVTMTDRLSEQTDGRTDR